MLAVLCCSVLHADHYVAMTLIGDGLEIGDREPSSKAKALHAITVYT
jgi:hypothetical protein